MRKYGWFLFIFVLFYICSSSAVLASHVSPVFVPGSPNCVGLGFDFGFKPQPEPPPSGTYLFPLPDTTNSITLVSDGSFFDWTSTLGLDAVIVKGGPNANVYNYDPEETADDSLSAPINPNNGSPYAIAHIEVCYDYEVDVEKTAETSFTRTYEWSILKSADAGTGLNLTAGQDFVVNYSVDVEVTGFQDSDWAVDGEIWISNNTPYSATITGVSDEISGPIGATVDCGVAFPHILAIGNSLHCAYSAALPDATNRLNAAEATTSGLVGGGTATADVVFGDPTTLVDDCADVGDDKGDPSSPVDLGTVCVADAPAQFNYSMTMPTSTCGPFEIDNIADILMDDSGATSSTNYVVSGDVTGCSSDSCTLTPGYWKTHSALGPAPFDDNWDNLPNAHDTPFFSSGQSYHEVLWTAPRGNAYYILAHAYIAAELNFLNGAPDTDVADIFAAATDVFVTYTPDEVADLKGKSGRETRNMIIQLALILDGYNNGLIGPGHCDETPHP